MATHSILPERFSSGDFASWFRHFERCALANTWNAATRLAKLPAFLQGPAATYFETLTDDQKSTYDGLEANLQACFSPSIHREHYYREFKDQRLRPAEDPALFLWRLKESLRNAEPELSETAFDALLRRQFMKGLPSSVQLKLLESDSTHSLDTMLSFSQRFRAIEELPRLSVCAAMDQPISGLAPEQHEQITRQSHEIKALQSMVREISEGQ